jgi:uncharacterized peroxidase-related enzyme
MPRIQPVPLEESSGPTRQTLLAVERQLGVLPNMFRTMARSPAVLQAYVSMLSALARGRLGARLGEQLALVVAEQNGCDYCLAAHTALGRAAGLSADQLAGSRRAADPDPRTGAALELARVILRRKGAVSDQELERARTAGLDDGEIAEVVAHVAINVFTNYFNRLAGTEVDFPAVGPAAGAAGAAA